MHGTYHFLVQVGSDPVGDAQSAFEEYNRAHCDENNWSRELDLICKDGRHFQIGSEEDAAKVSWGDAMNLAAQCVAFDFRLYGAEAFVIGPRSDGDRKIETMTCADIVGAIREEVPQTLAKAYTLLYETLKNGEKIDFLQDFQRGRLAQGFEMFLSAETPPFSTLIESPYVYRAYDLRDQGLPCLPGETEAILRVDIHT